MYLSDTHKHHIPPPPPPPHRQPPLTQSIDFYKDHAHAHAHHPQPSLDDPDDDDADRGMMIDVVTGTTTSNTTSTTPESSPLQSHHQHPTSHHPPYPHHQIVLNDTSSGGEDHDLNSTTRTGGNGTLTSSSAPKKRAETWIQDETRNLISLRRDMDSLFNTSKSNKHLWEQISAKMRERGFDRSPTMCTDKWRNLLKEFKKAKQHNGGNGSAKMLYYKEIEEILRERNKSSAAATVAATVAFSSSSSPFKCGTSGVPAPAEVAKVDSFMHFSDKGIEDASITFGPVDGNGRATLNLERHLDHDGHPLSIAAADTITAGGVPPSFWRETPGNGDETHSYGGRVISVKRGDYTRRVGIDGTPDAIKEAIKSAFGIRTKRAFWLEDEDNIIRSFDRDMPLGNYTLHLDLNATSECAGCLHFSGVTMKVSHYDESEQIVHTEKTFYTEEDFRDFLNRRGWSSVREYNAYRNEYRNIDNLDDIRPDGLYHGGT